MIWRHIPAHNTQISYQSWPVNNHSVATMYRLQPQELRPMQALSIVMCDRSTVASTSMYKATGSNIYNIKMYLFTHYLVARWYGMVMLLTNRARHFSNTCFAVFSTWWQHSTCKTSLPSF